MQLRLFFIFKLKLRTSYIFPLLLIIVFGLVNEISGQTLAFPNAIGHGRYTVGGRGGKVIHVTNLKDNGPGSLRNALEAKGPRIVVFDIGGIISLKKSIKIRSPYITIAGQTAPGGGITLKNQPIVIRTSQVIIRGLAIRIGDRGYKDSNGNIIGPKPAGEPDGISVWASANPIENVVLDHNSFTWAIDEAVDLSSRFTLKKVTISDNIIAECLHDSYHTEGTHSRGVLVSGTVSETTFARNLLAHNRVRNIYISDGTEVEFINNMVYDLGAAGTYMSYNSKSAIIGNHYIAGPSTMDFNNVPAGEGGVKNRGISNRIPVTGSIKSPGNINGEIYLKDNVGMGRAVGSKPGVNEYDEVKTILPGWEVVVDDDLGKSYLVESPPFTLGTNSNEILSSSEVESYVLSNVGTGDAIDRRIIGTVRSRTGKIIDTQEQVGGYGKIASGTPRPDQDNDGMPDQWELDHGLNPNNTDDKGDRDGDGYTNIEEYINSFFFDQ